MRRLPIYLLLDVSNGMIGEPIYAVEYGIQTMHAALLNDPNASDIAYLSVITFSDFVQQVVPLTELNQFVPPQLKVGGITSMGAALKYVAECVDREVDKGDWKPLVFIMTDGTATDNVDAGLEEFKKREMGD